MSHQTYTICFIAGVLGMALQVLLKVRSLKQKAKVGNVEFKVSDYFKDDWVSTAASLVTILIALVVTSELIGFNENVLKYIRLGFVFIGYTGSDIASRVFGVMSQRINKAIDYKTDVADGKIKE